MLYVAGSNCHCVPCLLVPFSSPYYRARRSIFVGISGEVVCSVVSLVVPLQIYLVEIATLTRLDCNMR